MLMRVVTETAAGAFGSVCGKIGVVPERVGGKMGEVTECEIAVRVMHQGKMTGSMDMEMTGELNVGGSGGKKEIACGAPVSLNA